MILHSKFAHLDEKIAKLDLSKWLHIGFALVLCSKFYYIWGSVEYYTPKAPIPIILIRDIIIFSFVGFFGFVARPFFKELRWFWILWVLGFVLSLVQLIGEKSFATWAQHYFRNGLIPMLFYPIFYGLFRAQIKFSIEKVLVWVFWINISACYLILLSSDSLQRPTGIYNDSIISSTILLWGLVSLFYLKDMWKLAMGFVAVLPLIYLMSSVSAVFCVALAIVALLIINFPLWKKQIPKYFRSAVFLFVLAGAVLFGVKDSLKKYGGGFEGLSSKIEYMYQAAFCVEQCWQNWSYQGRIASNLKPMELCKANKLACLFGKFNEDDYDRLESTWASIWLNWGGIFCIAYLSWILSHFIYLKRSFWQPGERNYSFFIWGLIFLSSIAFLIVNTIFYRLPVNALLYASMAHLALFGPSKNLKI